MALPPRIAAGFAKAKAEGAKAEASQKALQERAQTVPLPTHRQPPPSRPTKTIPV